MITLRWQLLILCLMATSAFGQNADDPAELVSFRQEFDKQMAVATAGVTEFNVKYKAALDRLLAAETKKGDLDAVLLVKSEIEAFGDGKQFDRAALQKRLSTHSGVNKLQQTYLTARPAIDQTTRKAVVALTANYKTKLEKLVATLTKANRIEGAVAAQTELRRLAAVNLVYQPTEKAPNTTSTLDLDTKANVDAVFHLVGKAKVEVYLNGEAVRFRTVNPESDGGIDGKSSKIAIPVDSIIVVRSLSHFSFRSVALALEIPAQKREIHFSPEDFGVLDDGDKIDPEDVDERDIRLASRNHPEEIIPDTYWVNRWKEHKLDDMKFSKPRSANIWSNWGAILTADDLLPANPASEDK